jgi:uncharacterized membrane protein
MANRIAAVIGVALFLAYVLMIVLTIRTGAAPLIVIALLVAAMVLVDAWQGGLRPGADEG